MVLLLWLCIRVWFSLFDCDSHFASRVLFLAPLVSHPLLHLVFTPLSSFQQVITTAGSWFGFHTSLLHYATRQQPVSLESLPQTLDIRYRSRKGCLPCHKLLEYKLIVHWSGFVKNPSPKLLLINRAIEEQWSSENWIIFCWTLYIQNLQKSYYLRLSGKRLTIFVIINHSFHPLKICKKLTLHFSSLQCN